MQQRALTTVALLCVVLQLAVGDVPPATLKLIADAVERRRP